MYGNCFGVHFLVGFIFLLTTRRVLPEGIIFSREICVSICTNRCEYNYFCQWLLPKLPPETIIFSYLSQNFQKIFSRIYTEIASLKIVTECYDSRLLHSALSNLFDFYASI